MFKGLKIACVIPARLKSTRFPEKVLHDIQEKPLLWWVWNQAKQVDLFDHVVIAVDDQRTLDIAKSWGATCAMTHPSLQSGTMRLIEFRKQSSIDADIWVNWQADSPMVNQSMIEEMLANAGQSDTIDIMTLKKKIDQEKEILNPNVVKVVTDLSGKAMLFSRSPIPFSYDYANSPCVWYKHIGLYAYTNKALNQIPHLAISKNQDEEKIEQLSFLEAGMHVQVEETEFDTIEIDRPTDAVHFKEYLHSLQTTSS